MFIELVDSLRCPRVHEDTWLVASVTCFDGRFIVEGSLGCPVCRQQYPVQRGVVDFTDHAGESRGARGSAPHSDPGCARPADLGADAGAAPRAQPLSPPLDDLVMRAAALLGLDDAGGVVLLGGRCGELAAALEALSPARALLLNPGPGVPLGAGFSAIRTDGAVPLAVGSVRGALVDETSSRREMLDGIVRALRPSGRLVAPAATPLPLGVRELARDVREWVAVADGRPNAPVPIRRA
ncbi:MAG: hypothetical protein Q8K82_03650 [Gemmatimonadaceae bacterium]|nr:hypothetical protein [Gemmatimonadaceae bacterium]